MQMFVMRRDPRHMKKFLTRHSSPSIPQKFLANPHRNLNCRHTPANQFMVVGQNPKWLQILTLRSMPSHHTTSQLSSVDCCLNISKRTTKGLNSTSRKPSHCPSSKAAIRITRFHSATISSKEILSLDLVRRQTA